MKPRLSAREIERQAELMMDALDHKYVSTSMTSEEYNRRVQKIKEWADVEYEYSFNR